MKELSQVPSSSVTPAGHPRQDHTDRSAGRWSLGQAHEEVVGGAHVEQGGGTGEGRTSAMTRREAVSRRSSGRTRRSGVFRDDSWVAMDS